MSVPQPAGNVTNNDLAPKTKLILMVARLTPIGPRNSARLNFANGPEPSAGTERAEAEQGVNGLRAWL